MKVRWFFGLNVMFRGVVLIFILCSVLLVFVFMISRLLLFCVMVKISLFCVLNVMFELVLEWGSLNIFILFEVRLIIVVFEVLVLMVVSLLCFLLIFSDMVLKDLLCLFEGIMIGFSGFSVLVLKIMILLLKLVEV